MSPHSTCDLLMEYFGIVIIAIQEVDKEWTYDGPHRELQDVGKLNI